MTATQEIQIDEGKCPESGQIEGRLAVGSAQEGADPVKAFQAWLEHATSKELEFAGSKFEQELLDQYRNREAWRMAMGQILYQHREIFKKRGIRGWTKWVTSNLHMARSTAYDLMRAWLQQWGHDLEGPKPSKIGEYLKAPLPKILVSREDCARFKMVRDRDHNGFVRRFKALVDQIIAEAGSDSDATSTPESEAQAPTAPMQGS